MFICLNKITTVETQSKYHSGGNGEEVPPVLIPNTEVKLFSAESTWLATAREAKTLPLPLRRLHYVIVFLFCFFPFFIYRVWRIAALFLFEIFCHFLNHIKCVFVACYFFVLFFIKYKKVFKFYLIMKNYPSCSPKKSKMHIDGFYSFVIILA